jgi:DNA-binding response OmpR family regulator
MEKRHVLVVDDEKNTRLALSLVFRKSGFSVTALADGTEALRKAEDLVKEGSPLDLLVIDIQIPGLTGLELVEELERRDLQLPILLISGYRIKRTVERVTERACVDYLEKPFQPHELMNRVQTLLERFALRQLAKDMEMLQKC